MISKVFFFVISAIISSTCGATTLFSNFGPGQTFSHSPGYIITNGGFFGYQSIAGAFSPSVTATLDTIDLPVWAFVGTTHFTIGIVADSAGVPGTFLETLSLTGIDTIESVKTVSSITHPLLSNGLTYWIVVAPGDPVTGGDWGSNIAANTGSFARSSDGGTAWVLEDLNTPAFDVIGTAVIEGVPEPSTALLLCGGLGVLWASWRRRAYTRWAGK